MCRVLTYIGDPILLDDLIYKPDNSLIKQTVTPQRMPHTMLNLAGFGVVGWSHISYQPQHPFIYRNDALPFYDQNLINLSSKLLLNCMVGHIRGVPYYQEGSIISNQNVHPFKFDNTPIAFAHNGSLSGFLDIKYDLYQYIKLPFRKRIVGTTDSETIYALFLSQLHDVCDYTLNDIFNALMATYEIIVKVRKQAGLHISSPLNLFLSDGKIIVATRVVLDFGHYAEELDATALAHRAYHSLWYTYGECYGCFEGEFKMKASEKNKSIIIASEPLTQDTTTWLEVPEYSILGAQRIEEKIMITSLDLII